MIYLFHSHFTIQSFVKYTKIVIQFVDEFYQFSEDHPEYQLKKYDIILKNAGLISGDEEVHGANVESLDEKYILALIMQAIRSDRFCEGSLLSFFNDGSILKWLKRLESIDNNRFPRPLIEIHFEIGSLGKYSSYQITFNNSCALLVSSAWCRKSIEKKYTVKETKILLESFKNLHVENWNKEYVDLFVLDGTQWELIVKYSGQQDAIWKGCNAFPVNWVKLLDFFGIDDDTDDYDE